jgi:C-methyltransferase
MFLAAQTSAVLSAAIELGLFPALAQGALTDEEVAKAIQAPTRSTRILLAALAVLEPAVLASADGRYSLTPIAREHLVPGSPRYLGDFALTSRELEGLARLADAVKNDGTVLAEHALTPQNPHWQKQAQGCGYPIIAWATLLAEWLAPWIKIRPALRVLDVACGSGANGFALTAQHPSGLVTLLDQPQVLESTRWAQQHFRVPDERVERVGGDLRNLDFGGPFDIVLLSHILHFFDPVVCQVIAGKAAAALRPGGRVVLHERLVDNLKTPDAIMFSVEMLSWSPTGEAYTKEHYDEWFRLAGLEKRVASPRCPDHFVAYER